MKIHVRVITRASRDEVVEKSEGYMKIKLTKAPVAGEANKALINFLSGELKVKKTDIDIIKGHSSSDKIIEIIDRS